MDTKVRFSPPPLLLGTGLFAACTAWLAFGPSTSGPVGRVLSSSGGAVTIVTVACGLAMTLFFAFHAIRAALGMPALVASDDALELYVLPFERFRLSEIEDVRIDAGKLMIVPQRGRLRRINLAILEDCDGAVMKMQKVLATQHGREHANT
jgi:hypothetical protein